MPQMIRACPFQANDRRDQPQFEPAALQHLRGRQSFAPLTALRLGQHANRQATIGAIADGGDLSSCSFVSSLPRSVDGSKAQA
jgi:hypothetical protein